MSVGLAMFLFASWGLAVLYVLCISFRVPGSRSMILCIILGIALGNVYRVLTTLSTNAGHAAFMNYVAGNPVKAYLCAVLITIGSISLLVFGPWLAKWQTPTEPAKKD